MKRAPLILLLLIPMVGISKKPVKKVFKAKAFCESLDPQGDYHQACQSFFLAQRTWKLKFSDYTKKKHAPSEDLIFSENLKVTINQHKECQNDGRVILRDIDTNRSEVEHFCFKKFTKIKPAQHMEEKVFDKQMAETNITIAKVNQKAHKTLQNAYRMCGHFLRKFTKWENQVVDKILKCSDIIDGLIPALQLEKIEKKKK